MKDATLDLFAFVPAVAAEARPEPQTMAAETVQPVVVAVQMPEIGKPLDVYHRTQPGIEPGSAWHFWKP